jgi:hypothetical protein
MGLLYAQESYVPGYIVIEQGDTIYGGLKHRRQTFSGQEMMRKIHIRKDKGGRGRYTRGQLSAYAIGDQIYRKFHLRTADIMPVLPAYYEIVPYSGQPYFLRLVKDGPLELYALEWDDWDNNIVEDFPLVHKKGDQMMVRATQGLFGFKKKALNEYLSDCPAVLDKLEKDEFRFAYQMVDFYNENCAE